MSGSHPKGKNATAKIWCAVIALIVVGATMQNRPITIAASDTPPSISTPVNSFNEANRMPMEERRAAIGSQVPDAQAGPHNQIFYRGGAVPP
jgi:hypothetical protein